MSGRTDQNKQQHSALMQKRAARVASSCHPLWLIRMKIHWWECICTHAQGESLQQPGSDTVCPVAAAGSQSPHLLSPGCPTSKAGTGPHVPSCTQGQADTHTVDPSSNQSWTLRLLSDWLVHPLLSGCHTLNLSLSRSLDPVVSLAVSLDLQAPPAVVSLAEVHTRIHPGPMAASVPGSPSHVSYSLTSSAWCVLVMTRWHTYTHSVHAVWSLQLLAPQMPGPS